jgi:hypothetical protein
MGVISQCPSCCACPAPVIEYRSRSASGSKNDGVTSCTFEAGGSYYRQKVTTRTYSFDQDTDERLTNTGLDAFRYIRHAEGSRTKTETYSGCTPSCTWTGSYSSTDTTEKYVREDTGSPWVKCEERVDANYPTVTGGDCDGPSCSRVSSVDFWRTAACGPVSAYSTSTLYFDCDFPEWAAYTEATTYDDEYTDDELEEAVVAEIGDWSGWGEGVAYSSADHSTDGNSYSITETQFRIRFNARPPRGCYRLGWNVRAIPEAGGLAASSAGVFYRGVYRPTVTLSAPPDGGIQALAVAVMSSAGGVSSIRILNPGSGYTSAPTVTVQSATGGGINSVGWLAALAGSQVSAIAGGTAGDYLPTGTISGDGTGATISFTMSPDGGIATALIGAGGSGYTDAEVEITSKVSGAVEADILLHLAGETSGCATWDGTLPEGFDPEDTETYPFIVNEGSIPVPSEDGETKIVNVRAVCDCTACPE